MYLMNLEVIMTGSWTMDTFIVGSIVLLAVPAVTALVRETKTKGDKKGDKK